MLALQPALVKLTAPAQLHRFARIRSGSREQRRQASPRLGNRGWLPKMAEPNPRYRKLSRPQRLTASRPRRDIRRNFGVKISTSKIRPYSTFLPSEIFPMGFLFIHRRIAVPW